jgi:hypothetical protein
MNRIFHLTGNSTKFLRKGCKVKLRTGEGKIGEKEKGE